MKICPIMSEVNAIKFQECKEHKCQFWTSAYTIEGIEFWDCAFVIMAKKNLEGRIPV